jgi:hypothetical protein
MGKGAPQIIACLEFKEGEENNKNWVDLEAGAEMYVPLAEHHAALGMSLCNTPVTRVGTR